MSHQYYAENHDWDLTLRGAWSLCMIAQTAEHLPTGGNLRERQFSSYLGSMLLSFCAIESFSASVAFSMPGTERFQDFDFDRYTRCSRFWDKLELLCSAAGYKIDKSSGLFQQIAEMQGWRNLVTHASPYRIGSTPVRDTTYAPRKLHAPFHARDYPNQVNLKNAKKFYHAAFEYIDLIKGLTDIDPRATAQYTVGKDDVRG